MLRWLLYWCVAVLMCIACQLRVSFENWWLCWQNWIITGGRFSDRITTAILQREYLFSYSRHQSQFHFSRGKHLTKNEDPNQGREILYYTMRHNIGLTTYCLLCYIKHFWYIIRKELPEKSGWQNFI